MIVIFPRLLSVPPFAIGAAYLFAYVLLDWVSFIYPFAPYGFTPWNPEIGLSFVLVLLFGQSLIPLIFLAPFLADLIVRHLPVPGPVEVGLVASEGCGYSLALLYLLRPKTRFNASLPTLRDVLLLLVIAALSAAVVTSSYSGVLVTADLLPIKDVINASLRRWVGDVIGIAIVAPAMLVTLTRQSRLSVSFEMAAQIASVFLILALVLALAYAHQPRLFYLLFLPIIWMAIRTGLEGVTVGILFTQLGVIASLYWLPASVGLAPLATQLQAFMLVMALTGLVAGALVSEHRRTEFQLRMHQTSLSSVARLGSMGELAAAIAHEINQPLMAAGTYSRLVLDQLREEGNQHRAIIDIAGKMAAQIDRASDVVRRLRSLVRLDKTGRAPIKIDRIVRETIELCHPDLEREGIALQMDVRSDLPPVTADLLQIQQVLLNLVRNAIEAIKQTDRGQGSISIAARLSGPNEIEVIVRDTGPGFPDWILAGNFPLLFTTKLDGLGMGLSLSRTIVEAHDGRLTIDSNGQGAVVRFTLPTAKIPHG